MAMYLFDVSVVEYPIKKERTQCYLNTNYHSIALSHAHAPPLWTLCVLLERLRQAFGNVRVLVDFNW